MLRAASVVRRPAVKAEKVIDTVVLDHDGRHKRRIVLTGRGGTAFLMDLDKATVLDDGDALKLEDGRLIAVEAAPEKLLEITAENPLRLLRTAWHIGNRHTPAEITTDAIYIEDDHVLAEMIRGQGCAIRHVERPFRPERGAYDHGHAHAGHDHAHGDACGCGHDHSHDNGHHHEHDHGHAHAAGGGCCGGAHAHGHDHAHDHAHEHHAHEHGASCGCGHDHAHDHSHDHAHSHGHEHSHGHKHG